MTPSQFITDHASHPTTYITPSQSPFPNSRNLTINTLPSALILFPQNQKPSTTPLPTTSPPTKHPLHQPPQKWPGSAAAVTGLIHIGRALDAAISGVGAAEEVVGDGVDVKEKILMRAVRSVDVRQGERIWAEGWGCWIARRGGEGEKGEV